MSSISFRIKLAVIVFYSAFVLFVSVRYLQNGEDLIRQVSDGRISPLMNTLLRSTADLHHGSWCVLPNAFAPRNDSSANQPPREHTTLVLHLSADLLDDSLIAQLENWNGPVSLAVYAMNPEVEIPCAAELIERLYRDHSAAMDHLRLHFFYKFPSSSNGSCTLRATASEDCSRRTRTRKDITTSHAMAEKTLEELAAYPANAARNIARKYASSKFILLADYDHMFSEGFESRLSELAERELSTDPLAVLVYRIFEIDDAVKENPKTKADLAKLLADNEGRAIIFHAKYYSSHSIPGLQEWLRKDSGTGDGIFARNLTFHPYSWEPQFVSLTTIPEHDENFPYMIRDNTCLRWEMCRAGYHLQVVDDHFMFHRGIKKQGTAEFKKIKQAQRMNSKKFDAALQRFNQRMNETYPSTARNCPKFAA